MTHDLRCERSKTDPRRCRCKDCGGRQHGTAAVRERLGIGVAEPEENDKEPLP